MLLAIVACFAFAIAAPALHRVLGRWTGKVLAIVPLALAIGFAFASGTMASVVEERRAWLPALDVAFAFRLDGLSRLFALLVTSVGAIVLVYGGGYLEGRAHVGRFYAFVLAFMASMLGVVLADDLLLLYAAWELTSVCSFLMIGFDHQKEEARYTARQALLVTVLGGLALLAGVLLLAQVSGTTRISELLARGDVVRSSPLYAPILALILLGALTKSAQAPFHFWLPAAMTAPTPVSAYLHAATMVKAGIFLLARLSPVLSGTAAFTIVVTAVGAATAVVGAVLSVVQTDLKRLLAYSTVSALGLMTLLIGIGSETSLFALALFVIAHALYKGALFLVAGMVDHETGARDVGALSGLRRAMPLTFAIAAAAGLSMAALPPTAGLVAKETLIEAVLHRPSIVVSVLAASVSFVVVAWLTAARPFLGAPRDTPRAPTEPSWAMTVGPALLSASSLAIGLAPEATIGALARAAASESAARAISTRPALFHGLGAPLAVTVVSALLGAAVARLHPRLVRLRARGGALAALGPTRGYALGLKALDRLAHVQTRVLQNGKLRAYLGVVIVSTVALAGVTVVRRLDLIEPHLGMVMPRVYEAGLALLVLFAAVVAVQARSRIASITALGVVGYSIALVFQLFGAPDLAMTQFTVETLTVILFVLALRRLPPLARRSLRGRRLRDFAIALPFGALMTVLVLASWHVQLDEPVSRRYLDAAVPEGHGRNVVNVILVDFRALDTLGEITVLAVAAVGAWALLAPTPRRARVSSARVSSARVSSARLSSERTA